MVFESTYIYLYEYIQSIHLDLWEIYTKYFAEENFRLY